MSYIPDPVKIFVVEDDPLYMKLVNYVAELNPDHVVRTFTSGKECLEHLHENPTVVTLDYSLPDMSGEEVLTKIKKYNKASNNKNNNSNNTRRKGRRVRILYRAVVPKVF